MTLWICRDCGIGPRYDLSCRVETIDKPTRCPFTVKDEDGQQQVPRFVIDNEEVEE